MNKLSHTGDENNLPLLHTSRKTLPYKNLRLTIYKKHRHARRAGVIFFVNKKPLEVLNGAYQSIVKP